MPSELAEQISQIPKLFAATNKSTACLLKEFGFPQTRHALSVDDLEAILKRDPHLADLWFKRSADQRLVGGWGIEAGSGVFHIQSYSDGHCLDHHDRCRACAEFIVRYVNFIGDILARWS